MNYKVRYGILPSHMIFNAIEPPKMHRDHLDDEYQFFEKLENSILKDGFLNPIMVHAGNPERVPASYNIPQSMRDHPHTCIVSLNNGGSRLWVAQKHSLDIPCLITDWADVFPDLSVLKYPHEVRACYGAPPEKIVFSKSGLYTNVLPHTHLGDEKWGDRKRWKI